MSYYTINEDAARLSKELALRAMKWKKDDHLAHGGSWAVSDDYGIMHCEKCGSELLCNDSGDMPEYCPQCGRQIDWASFDF